MGTESTKNSLFYRLSFGNIIAYKGQQPPTLQLKQGSQKVISDGSKSYYLLLRGVKVNRQIYQPIEIEAELDMMQTTTDASRQEARTAPQFEDIRGLLLQREVDIDILEVEGNIDSTRTQDYKNIYSIATNCYVYEMTPQLKRDGNSTKMYVKLSIFSMDKLMTLNKYSKAYVARKLGSEILQPESLRFGIVKEGEPLIESDIKHLQHLKYTEGDESYEFIQPYLVQYNESFYDFLVRTANRCGEFLYFEDGKLVLGLPDSTAQTIEDFNTVTIVERSADPFKISAYARDSVKDGMGAVKGTADAKEDDNGALELNISAIARQDTGFPSDAFPKYISSNAELAQDDYIFPLYIGKFTNKNRELNYDGNASQTALARLMPFTKTLMNNEIDGALGGLATLAIEGVVGEGIPQLLAKIRENSYNNEKGMRYIAPLANKQEQFNGEKAIEFSSLNTEGWTTLNYYQDILQHEEAQQRQIVCIDMGTNFIDVKLGQKIKIDGINDEYVIIQIQQTSEKAWNHDYDRYGMVADDKYTGERSLKIYAIPGYGEKKNQFIPPVHPVPVIRKAGPQTAFVTDNEDPKFQGRVRIAFPWQSLGNAERDELDKVNADIFTFTKAILDCEDNKKKLLTRSTKTNELIKELKKYVNASKEEREAMLQKQKSTLQLHQNELKRLQSFSMVFDKEKREKDIKDKEEEISQDEQAIIDFEAAAKEHDQKKGSADYQDAEKDNTVICRYMTNYKKYNQEYHKAEEDKKQAEEDKEKKKKVREKLVEHIDKDVKAMATPWVRVVSPMATPGGGTFFRPRVGDEVLVNFENDNVERPYVVGSVFSKNNLTPDEKMYRQRGVELQGRDVSIAMMSPNGHHITFQDPDYGANFLTNLVSPGIGLWGTIVGYQYNAEKCKDLAGGIHIGDRYGIYEIDMKSHKRSIEINSPYGTVAINAFSGITVNAPNGDVTIRGKNINLEAGNKVNITSGMNIQDPSLGDPDGRLNSFGKVMNDIWGEIIPGEITKYLFRSVFDLSYMRHVVEIFVRPVDGTLKLKSKRYLMLEAGKGNATIRRDRYAAKVQEKKESQEEFFKAMLVCVKFISEKVDLFYDAYQTLWTDGYKKRITYENDGIALNLKDIKNPNLRKLAYDTDEWSDEVITESTYKDCIATVMFPLIEKSANAYTEAAFKIYRHIESLENLLDDYSALPLGDFKWMGDSFAKAINELDDKTKWAKGWMHVYANGNEEKLVNDSEPDPKGDKFAMPNKSIHKRKLLLTFINMVSQDSHNEKNKYFECNLKMDYVMSTQSLRQEYYWNRMVVNLDRGKRLQKSRYGRTIWDNTLGMVWNKIKSNFVPFDRDIWNDKADGQILFSDQENKTLNFQGEGLHEESSSNIGTLDHLKKELMAIK